MSVVEGITAAEFQNLDAEIKRTMRYSAKAVVGLGFLLRKMAEQKLWTVQYDCLDDYLREELHMDYTMASRFIGINKKYSVGGNSTEIEPMWADYSQAALIEMLSMPPELEAEITPDMTVKQIRSVKHAARKAKTELKKEAEPVKEKKCDTYPGYTCNIEEIVKKHFIKGGLIEGCARCCAVCLKKRECKYACEAVITMDVIKLADIPEEQTHVIPAQEDTGKVSGDEILDAEYRELETIEEVATSQPMVSAYGLEKTEYPEGSLLTTVGCGHRYYCFSCAQECDIRQEMCFCQTAPLGDPFGCDTVSLIETLKANVGNKCQFVNNTLAFHTRGTNEAAPCCRECNEDCEYRCERSRSGKAATQKTDDPEILDTVSDDSAADELTEIKHILKREQETLQQFLEVGGLPDRTVFRQKTIVAALTAMVCDLEDADPELQEEAAAQPELPMFKNNNQRKEWLRAYKDWGLWYRDENIGVEYYKYDFDNGARLIAEVYPREESEYHGDYELCHLHLVGGPKPPKGAHGIGKWARHKRFSCYPDCETELVEFLKEVQKR